MIWQLFFARACGDAPSTGRPSGNVIPVLLSRGELLPALLRRILL